MKKHLNYYKIIMWSICVFAVLYGSLILVKAFKDAFPEEDCVIKSSAPIKPNLLITVNEDKPNDTIYVYTQ